MAPCNFGANLGDYHKTSYVRQSEFKSRVDFQFKSCKKFFCDEDEYISTGNAEQLERTSMHDIRQSHTMSPKLTSC